jgi:hypothetical protein
MRAANAVGKENDPSSISFFARFVPGNTFASSEDLREALSRAEIVDVAITVTA